MNTLSTWAAQRKMSQLERVESNTEKVDQLLDKKMNALKHDNNVSSVQNICLLLDHLRKAELTLIKYIQQQHNATEMYLLEQFHLSFLVPNSLN